MTQENKDKEDFEYHIYLDYSERLVGYIIIHREKIRDLLPLITKLHHYKDIKYKKAYLQSVKKTLEKNRVADYLLKCRIKELKDNLSIFVEILDFVKKYENCRMFISIDDNQFIAFSRLLRMMQLNVATVNESRLKKGSVEHKLSLIIDTILNVERVSKK